MHPVLGAAGPRHRACRNALYWKKSKCRHVLSSVSCTGQEPSSQPATEHPKRAPRGKSRYRSSRPCATSKSERVTRHGSPNPKAVLNRSRVSDIRPIPQHWATERHDPSWPTPRTPGRDTAKPTRSGEEPFSVVLITPAHSPEQPTVV